MMGNLSRRIAAAGVLTLLVGSATGKPSKSTLPAYILTAHTVAVVIDPEAGMSITDPRANQQAQKDVEAALVSWGRFLPVLSEQQADLVIVLRKGSGKLVDETIPDPRQNSRPGSVTTTPNTTSIGVQQGRQPNSGGFPDASGRSGSNPQMEVGNVDDAFEVYQGQTEKPLDGPVAWRYIRKDGLHSHDVPAVDEFRKAIAEAEKQAAKQAGKHP